ncbi:two-component system, repressor protein LuxO [Modicisalibacter muralis]|uniref:Two-component system, repressor protein LuxO n=1 Tax=Modicisalibacter muralis TaxID=119000 RepID=A0A1G9RDS0_9GAMM|nr:sigma-54 dependent transcriptional regulator [Halomonas muralis]SDM20595.1 two-component system, repressor protein LuxO [Halomonas muralis]
MQPMYLSSAISQFENEQPPGKFIGTSASMKRLYQSLRLIAGSDAPVFIMGESGTGKELCAEALHKCSARRQAPFVAVNCAAIPADLLETQLFGHLKGAFTGALCDQQGYAVAAHGGTLFLDEIGELGWEMQSKLLRFLQTGAVVPVGATSARSIDCRIICATNANPAELIEQGRFREDLYYRLHVIPVTLPPLRDRDRDVIDIAHALLVRFAEEERKAFQRLSPTAEQALLRYSWPGNVRELENVLRRAIVMHDGDTLTEAMLHLPVAMLKIQAVSRRNSTTSCPLWMVERDAIEQAISECGGNVPRAAALLEVAPSTLYRKRLGWK